MSFDTTLTGQIMNFSIFGKHNCIFFVICDSKNQILNEWLRSYKHITMWKQRNLNEVHLFSIFKHIQYSNYSKFPIYSWLLFGFSSYSIKTKHTLKHILPSKTNVSSFFGTKKEYFLDEWSRSCLKISVRKQRLRINSRCISFFSMFVAFIKPASEIFMHIFFIAENVHNAHSNIFFATVIM